MPAAPATAEILEALRAMAGRFDALEAQTRAVNVMAGSTSALKTKSAQLQAKRLARLLDAAGAVDTGLAKGGAITEELKADARKGDVHCLALNLFCFLPKSRK